MYQLLCLKNGLSNIYKIYLFKIVVNYEFYEILDWLVYLNVIENFEKYFM